MKDILKFLEDVQVWIYVLLGSASIIPVRELFLSWKELRSSVFGLEREKAQRRLSISLTVVILLAMLVAAEFVLATFVAPEVSMGSPLATPTLDLLATPTLFVQEDAVLLEGEAGNEAQTGQPTTPPATTESCIAGVIEWISPASGEDVSGRVELVGVINVDNLGFFKYEFSQPGSAAWSTIAAGNVDSLQIPEDSTIKQFTGIWNTEQLVPGDYLLRLVVTDNQNQLLPICVVPVRVITP